MNDRSLKSSASAATSRWRQVTIDEVAKSVFDGPFGSHLKSDDYSTFGRSVVRLENIGVLKFNSDKETFISEEKFAQLTRHILVAGDVLFSSFLAEEVRVCQLPPELSGAAVNKADCFCVRVDPEICSAEFLKYRLACRSTFFALQEQVHGATRPRINLKQLRAFEFDLPPLDEQKRIVDKLDALLARVDACRERLDRVPGILKRFRQVVLEAAISGNLTENWRVAHSVMLAPDGGYPLRRLAEVLAEPLRNGKSVRDGDGLFVLRLSALKRGCVDTNEAKRGDWRDVDSSRFLAMPGDFLVARGNGSLDLVGRGGLVEQSCREVAFPDTMIRVRVDQSLVLSQYIRTIWDSTAVRRQIELAVRTTAGIWKIAQPELENIEIPVPPLGEQTEVVRRVGGFLALAESLEARCAAAHGAVERVAPALLVKAFCGALVPEGPGRRPSEGG